MYIMKIISTSGEIREFELDFRAIFAEDGKEPAEVIEDYTNQVKIEGFDISQIVFYRPAAEKEKEEFSSLNSQ